MSAAPTYDPSQTLRQGRRVYFDAFGFDDRSYTATWVELKKVAGIPLGFPNSAARIRAVKLHELHHVVTGYAADWIGEAEIAAWEVGAGCHRHHAAWILNLLAMQYGVVLAPRRVLRALARGRRSETLYRMPELDESILGKTVGELRRELRLDAAEAEPTPADVLALVGWTFAGAALWMWPYALAASIYAAASG
jgi:hypothetical protein